jgi:hypothetical protein
MGGASVGRSQSEGESDTHHNDGDGFREGLYPSNLSRPIRIAAKGMAERPTPSFRGAASGEPGIQSRSSRDSGFALTRAPE